jgi:phage terminase large subunit-like protein
LLQELEQAGILCVDVPQTFMSLTDALNQTEVLLKGGRRLEGTADYADGNSKEETADLADFTDFNEDGGGTDIKLVKGRMLQGRMTHEANPVARWCFGNTSIAQNGQGFIKFVKEHKGKTVLRTKRIDLTAAWINAMARARFYAGNVDLSAAILADDWGM